MLSHFKKLIAFVTIVAVVACMFYCINVSAGSTVWSPFKGSPTLTDKEDDYTYVSVGLGSQRSAYTNDKYNFEENALYVRDFTISEANHWGAIAFSTDKKSSSVKSDPENGFLVFLVRISQSNANKLQLFFSNGTSQIELGNISRGKNLFIRFVKTNSGYAMQVNEKLITNDYITKFCSGDFHKNSFIVAHSENFMRGDFKISKPLWLVSDNGNEPSVYRSEENKYGIVSKVNGGVAYTDKKIDLSTNGIQLKNLNVEDGTSFTLNFNISSPLQSKADFSVKFEAYEDLFNVYSGYDLLGEISKTDILNISTVKKNGSYNLVVNGKVYKNLSKLNSALTSNSSLYLSVSLPKDFSTVIAFPELMWKQYAGIGNAVVDLNENATNHIEVISDQGVASPEAYDILTTGITLSNLEITAAQGSDSCALLYFGKTLDSNISSSASKNAITFCMEYKESGLAFNLINSNGIKSYIGTVAKTDKYNISFSIVQKSRTLKVNNTEFRLDKFENDESILAGEDIIGFLEGDDENFVYIALSTTGYVKADVEVFNFVKPVSPSGVSLYSDGAVTAAKGDDEKGYTGKSSKEAYMITNLVNDHSIYALDTRLKTVNGAVYFAISKTDVQDKNFWVCGDGSAINRVGFVITPVENNTKAQISYYGADGVNAKETVIAVIDFDWTARHSYGVRLSDDGNWYLYVDGEEMNQITSAVLNAFMDANENEELFFIFGSKQGIDVSLFKSIKHPVTLNYVDAEGWSTYSGKIGQLEKDDESDTYIYPADKGPLYAIRNGSDDVSKNSLKVKISSLADGKFIYLGISATDISDTNFLPKGAISVINRIGFRIYPDFTNNTLTIKGFNYDGNGGEVQIAKIENFDFTVAHTFDVRLCSNNNWYLCVDNVVFKDYKFDLLQQFMEKYNAKSLRYAFGASGIMGAEELSVVPQGKADVYINVETWHYVSNNRGVLEGNDIDGYSLHKEKNDAFAYTDLKYDPNTTALSLKITDFGEWVYFAVCTSDYTDTNFTPKGTGDTVKRTILLIYPEGSSSTFRYWCSDGTSLTPANITSYKFDWSAESHTFDVRYNEEDGNWYFCVDGRLLMNKISATLNQFMKTNAGQDLRYCFGGKGCLGIENAKVVDKPPLIGSGDGDTTYEDGDYEESQDFGFEFEFDNIDQDFELESEEINPLDYLNKVKVKKRRLVSAAHGIIFTKLEIAGMIAGGVAVLGAATFLAIFLIKKRKKKKAVK